MRTVLALDIATTTGWAYGPIGQPPRCGHLRLAPPGAPHGAIGMGLLRWLNDFRKVNPECRDVWIEAPFDPRHMGRRTTMNVARILLGLVFLAETLCEASGMRVTEVDVNEVRRHLLGKGKWTREVAKPLVMDRLRVLGIPTDTNDEGDAAALHVYASSILLARRTA